MSKKIYSRVVIITLLVLFNLQVILLLFRPRLVQWRQKHYRPNHIVLQLPLSSQ